ncbi:MAG: IS1182 family transposase [Cyanobacteria bacterium J06642_2]
MMGDKQVMQEGLFYEFTIERHVPEDHLLRVIDRFLDLEDVRAQLKPFYATGGRPSIDPELMIRMLIAGYCYGIRSERRLCEEVNLNLAYRWFCKLSLTDPVPDHSTFSKNRHGRFRESDLFRKVFETVLTRCIAEGAVGGEAFAVDASIIRADANRERGQLGSEDIPETIMRRRAVQEYIETLDEAAFGGATSTPPKYLSPVDPAARWTRTYKDGAAKFSYATNYLIDCENAIIVDVEATTALRPAEVGATRTMLDRLETNTGLKPKRLSGDTAYGSAEMLNWLVKERGIEPHIPVFAQPERTDGIFPRSAFRYDPEEDRYICPGGKNLRRYRKAGRLAKAKPPKDGLHKYRAKQSDCDACALKPKCCPNLPHRKVPRSVYEEARDVARKITASDAYLVSRRERKKVEMLFAHLKRILKLHRLRLRGPNGARDEFLLAATAQNLRKIAKLHIQGALQATG